MRDRDEGIVHRDAVTGRSGIADHGVRRRIGGIVCGIGMRIRFQIARFFIHIDPQHAGEEILVDALTVITGIILVALVPKGNVEVAIRAKLQATSLVIGVVVGLFDEDELRSGVGDIGVAGRAGETGNPLEDRRADGAVPVDGIEEVK